MILEIQSTRAANGVTTKVSSMQVWNLAVNAFVEILSKIMPPTTHHHLVSHLVLETLTKHAEEATP